MAKDYTIPQLLKAAGVLYIPGVGAAFNQLIAAKDPAVYQQAKKSIVQSLSGYQNVNLLEQGDIKDRGGAMLPGVALYMPLTLLADGADTGAQGNNNGTAGTLLDSAIVSLNRARTIVTTDVQGRDSSIKEFINNGDWTITIDGVIASEGIGYPLDKVEKLNKALAEKRAHKVEHEVLNKLEINEIVITDYGFPKSAIVSLQPYQITAISEKPIELLIDE